MWRWAWRALHFMDGMRLLFGVALTLELLLQLILAAPVQGCNKCPEPLNIKHADFAGKTEEETTTDESTGCSIKTVTCVGQSSHAETFIEFNDSGAGINSIGSKTIKLTCNKKNQWVFTEGQSSLIVNSMSCQSAD